MKIGLDFGGVIVKTADGPVAFDPSRGLGQMVPGAFDAIAELVAITDGNTWIVSKASSVTQAATRLWLGQTGFYQRTGFPAGNIWFCERRADKAGICRNLSISHFVDDQLEVLNHLREIVPDLYHFGVDPILSWQDVLSAMRA